MLNYSFTGLRIAIAKMLAKLSTGRVPLPEILKEVEKSNWYVWYGFGMDWKGLATFVLARLLHRRKDHQWDKIHSVLVTPDKISYHLTDTGAELGLNAWNLCFYPLYYLKINKADAKKVYHNYLKAKTSGVRVHWMKAFNWSVLEDDDVYLCHHFVQDLLED